MWCRRFKASTSTGLGCRSQTSSEPPPRHAQGQLRQTRKVNLEAWRLVVAIPPTARVTTTTMVRYARACVCCTIQAMGALSGGESDQPSPPGQRRRVQGGGKAEALPLEADKGAGLRRKLQSPSSPRSSSGSAFPQNQQGGRLRRQERNRQDPKAGAARRSPLLHLGSWIPCGMPICASPHAARHTPGTAAPTPCARLDTCKTSEG